MGHYDSQYEAQEERERKDAARGAQSEASRLKLRVLPESGFKPLGVCGTCAEKVYSVPNWGCTRRGHCPHKP